MFERSKVLENMLRTGVVLAPDGTQRKLHSNVPLLEGEAIQAWVARCQPRRPLEIGFACGVSSLFICDAIKKSEGVCYDIIDNRRRSEWEGIGIANLQRAGFGGAYRLHEEDSVLCLPRMVSEGRRFDFALVDSWHAFDHTLVEFFYINRMMPPGGVILFDDSHTPGIKKLAAYIDGSDCYERLGLPPELEKRREIRVRRLNKIPPLRVIGFRKTGDDRRGPYWFKEF